MHSYKTVNVLATPPKVLKYKIMQTNNCAYPLIANVLLNSVDKCIGKSNLTVNSHFIAEPVLLYYRSQ